MVKKLTGCRRASGTCAQSGERLKMCEREDIIDNERLLGSWLGSCSEPGRGSVLPVKISFCPSLDYLVL